MPPVQLRPGINIYLTTTDQCLPIIAWKCNDPYCSWSSQLVPSTSTWQYFFPCLYLCGSACLKKCSENRELVVVLQIGAKDLTVMYPICILSPSHAIFFGGLSLALRLHDQLEAPHWLTLLPPSPTHHLHLHLHLHGVDPWHLNFDFCLLSFVFCLLSFVFLFLSFVFWLFTLDFCLLTLDSWILTFDFLLLTFDF